MILPIEALHVSSEEGLFKVIAFDIFLTVRI